jgi:hypothetical protein
VTCALGGMLVGMVLSKKIKGQDLKKGFGYFVWGVAMLIMVREILEIFFS